MRPCFKIPFRDRMLKKNAFFFFLMNDPSIYILPRKILHKLM